MSWYDRNPCVSEEDGFEAEIASRLSGLAGGKDLAQVGLQVTGAGLSHFLNGELEVVMPLSLATDSDADSPAQGELVEPPGLAFGAPRTVGHFPGVFLEVGDEVGNPNNFSPGIGSGPMCCYAPRIYDLHHAPAKGGNPTPPGATKNGEPVDNMYFSMIWFRVVMKWKAHAKELPCTLHWEERSNRPYRLPDGSVLPGDGEYHDISDQNSDTVNEFNARVADSRARAAGVAPQPPAGREFLTVTDTPGYPIAGGGRQLTGKFWIISGCPGEGTSSGHAWRQDVSANGQMLFLDGVKTYP
ncbi:MAG: hypothetical protein AB7T63_00325 [Planctomycetota bacterium]